VLSETTDEAGSTVEQTLSESGEVSEKVVVGEASTTRGVGEQKGEVQLTRAAERRAKDLGVDLSQVEGTGSGGRIKEQR
jgi:pyruvate/2-oxoglutarate dehydrogenase complex dihydrolipoamide acyltransferase (E2) component